MLYHPTSETRDMPRIVSLALFTALWFCAGSALSDPSPRRPIDDVIEQLSALVDYQEAVISPDGRLIAWAQGVPETNSSSARSAVFVARADGGGGPRPIEAAPHHPHGEAPQVARHVSRGRK